MAPVPTAGPDRPAPTHSPSSKTTTSTTTTKTPPPRRQRAHHRSAEPPNASRPGPVRKAPDRSQQRRAPRAGGLRLAGAALRPEHGLTDPRARVPPHAAAPGHDAEPL